ncbi:RNA polymerase sigma factor [Dyadobacter sp. BHUBP1]|uniref:RNA polymerase sigma factor n=1 Tax=Dyadobacter sp. BHUBP1 TaxID=3424178 RepID=UPI003D330F22
MLFRKKKRYQSIEELVIGCQKSEASAQSMLYEMYKKRMMSICQRYARTSMEGDEIFQDAFVKVFKNIGELRNISAVDGWIKMIVVRTAIDYYKRTTKQQLLLAPVESIEVSLESEDYKRILSDIDMQKLLEIIRGLPNGYRTVINLHHIDGYTHEEIGEMLSISPGTSKSQTVRGRNLLLRKLEEQGIIEHDRLGRKS